MSSPADTLFEDINVTLAGGRWRDMETGEWTWDEVTLYIDYKFEAKGLRFSIHNDVTRKTELDKFADNLGAATAVLKKIAAEYPGKLQMKKLLPVWEVFFRAVEGFVEISSPVAQAFGEACAACGTVDTNSFTFLYVPAIPDSKLYDASVSLSWEFGSCSGALTVEGALDDVEAEAREVLGRMLDSADDQYKPAVQAALAAL